MMRKGRQTQEQPVNTGPRVSELLKTTRERSAQELQTISQILRIRLVYLQAIEDGKYDELPGKTYVVGFVRAYSEHLGLDADEVVKRFKEEIAGLEGKAELVFPSPVTEQSVPGGAIVLIGLIILGAAYGGWYFFSSQDRSVAELVPDLPAKFAEMMDQVKTTKEDEKTEPVVEETQKNGQEEKTPAPSEPVSEADTQDMAQKALAAVEQAEQQTQETVQTVETVKVEDPKPATETPVVEAEKTPEPVVEKVEEKVAEKIEETAAKVEEKKEEAVEAVSEQAEEATATIQENVPQVTETPAVEEAAAEPEPAQPQPMTETVILKAVDYSWVQVTDDKGNVIHTQVLNEGDEYQVPHTQGLILRTGNAGGLEIQVDGEKVPAIGKTGDVLRKVLLDPKKLKAGSAVEG